MFTSCGNKDEILPVQLPATIAFLSHTRMDQNENINPQLSYVDWTQYHTLLLGGDLGENTSANSDVMDIYDSHFDFDNPNCIWALGNHDINDLNLIDEYTDKAKNPFLKKDNVGIFALNEYDENDFISSENLSKIKESANQLIPGDIFILLTHKLIWLAAHPELGALTNSIANGQLGDCSYCTKEGNFYEVLYPFLNELEEKGIEVICLAGDLGFQRKRFEYLTDSGVQFLANGFNKADEENEFIEFYEDKDELKWRYVNIENRK